MTDPVRALAPKFADKFEGKVPWMYQDVKGLITVARGNLIDPVQYALPLTFQRPDGTEADVTEVLAQWKLIKSIPNLAIAGHTAVPPAVKAHGQQLLKMSEESMDRLFFQKYDQNERHLVGRFKDMPSWPQDARLFLHSMAWACGAGFRYPLMEAFLRAQKFDLAIAECTIKEAGNPGVVPRNVANRILLRTASVVVMSSMDRETLHWPGYLEPPVSAADLPLFHGEREEETGSGPTIHVQEYPYS